MGNRPISGKMTIKALSPSTETTVTGNLLKDCDEARVITYFPSH